MKAYEIAAGLFWLALSTFVMIEGVRLGLGSASNPSMGFVPFWAAFLLAGLSLVATLVPLRTRAEPGQGRALFPTEFFSKVLPTFGVLVAYVLTLPLLGFLIGTLILLSFLFYFAYRGPIWHIGAAALFITLGCWFLFQQLLKTQFPRGIFGI